MTQANWLVRRSLRLRVTLIASVVLTIGLAVGAAGLSVLFVRARVAAVDVVVQSVAQNVSELVAAGELPAPLPVPATGTALAQVIDAGGTVLAATAGASQVLPMLPLPRLASAHAGQRFTTSKSALGPAPLRVEVVPATYRGVPVTVVAAVPFADVHDTLLALRRVVILVVPLLVVAVASATWLAVGSALEPVDDLRAAADAVDMSATGVETRLPVPVGARELSQLGETLNRMLSRLHQSNERQREFIADAAHELRSPIASVRTQLEVALATPTDAAAWPVVARDVLTDVERLGRLADDLLLLARLDAGAASAMAAEPVDLAELAGQPEPAALVTGDAVALRRMLDNLVTNARRHAALVEVTVSTADGQVVVLVDDDGPGLSEAEMERVFERWVRLDEARSREEGGSGLGLPIARSIARAHGGDVTLATSPLGGLRAVVTLPAAAGSMPQTSATA
ncbi:MAG: HAMP domain-containing sensor histidine kinase [Actinomycetota bacterium]